MIFYECNTIIRSTGRSCETNDTILYDFRVFAHTDQENILKRTRKFKIASCEYTLRGL